MLKGKKASRAPLKPRLTPNDLYISKSTKFRRLLQNVKKILITDKKPFVILHGLGARTCNASFFALKLKDTLKSLNLTLSTTISTTKVIDDIEPDDEEEDIISVSRQLPTIHIKISKASDA